MGNSLFNYIVKKFLISSLKKQMNNNVFPINGKTKLEQNIVGSEEKVIGILPRQKQRTV